MHFNGHSSHFGFDAVHNNPEKSKTAKFDFLKSLYINCFLISFAKLRSVLGRFLFDLRLKHL